MTFTQFPTASALGLLAATGLAIVLIYLLKPPPQRVVVPSTLLWEKLAAKPRPRDRWRTLLSLLISLMIALGLAAVLAGADIMGDNRLRRPILVIDDAPSMAAGANQTRMDAARDAARQLIAGALTPITIADTSSSFGIRTFSTPAAALEALDEIIVHANRPTAFPKLPADWIGGDRHLVVITDGVHALEIPDTARVVDVYEPVENVGISRFETRARVAGSRSLFLEVHNGGEQPSTSRLQIEDTRGTTLVDRDLDLRAGERWTAVLDLDQSRAAVEPGSALRGTVLTPDDGYRQDDRAWARAPVVSDIALGFAGPDDSAVKRVLEADPGVSVTSQIETAPRLVLEGVAPESPPLVPTLLIAPPNAPWLPSRAETKSAARFSELRLVPIASTASSSPLAADHEDTRVIEGAEIEEVLVFEDDALDPLLVSDDDTVLAGWVAASPGSELEAPVLVLTFDPSTSNLPLADSFPLLISALVRQLDRVVVEESRGPGLHEVDTSLDVTTDGARRTLMQDQEGQSVRAIPGSPGHDFFELQAGLYESSGGAESSADSMTITPRGPVTLRRGAELQVQRLELAGSTGPGLSWIAYLVAALIATELWLRSRGLTE